MASHHTVKQGEHLTRISRQYGFADYRTIWDHPRNAPLKQKRQNPNVLFQGDSLYVPDKQEKKESRSTTQVHRFQVPSQTVMLRVVLRNPYDDQPLVDIPCKLEIGGKVFALATDRNGQIEQRISVTAEEGKLIFRDPLFSSDREVPVRVGHLDPVEERSGWVARLYNLGYYRGPVDQPDENELRSAVEEFQCENDLKVDGICGPRTQAKLKDVHGC